MQTSYNTKNNTIVNINDIADLKIKNKNQEQT